MIREGLHGIKILRSYRLLVKTARARGANPDLDLIKRAFTFAHKAHREQKRLSGEPYIIHPIAVAQILAGQGLDSTTIAAALLHDVVEDTGYGVDTIKTEFGEEIQNLVKAVTKISLVKKEGLADTQRSAIKAKEAAENIRLMLLATAQDVRVILIKLADKLHNVRTLEHHRPDKVQRIADEVLNIYAPIAGRLGMFRVKSELEDLAFQHIDADSYREVQKSLSQSRSELEAFIKAVRKILKQRLNEISIEAKVEGRAKHLYSIYQKMIKQEKPIHEIYDLRGMRIIVNEIRDCYGALGIVHTLWPPIPGRFKDYIATPKINGYQSLHTTVVGPDGKPLEIQIRTYEMDERADHGIAAHWLYKNENQNSSDRGRLRWLSSLARLTSEFQGDSQEFIEDLRNELEPQEVYVFTPNGDIIDLPMGATVLDFAFRIHTDIGLRCRGARVNDRIAPLRTELKSGDRVEVLTEKKPNPSPNWLRYLHSSGSRQKLRAYFRKKEEDEQSVAPAPVAEEKIPKPIKEKLEHVQELRIRRSRSPDPKQVPIEVAGARDIQVRYAGCCSPVPGDPIVGFITRGRGVSVHKADCPSIPREGPEAGRVIAVKWEGLTEKYPVRIEVNAEDRRGLYLDLVSCLTRTQTNILKAEADIPRGGTEKKMKAVFLLEVEHVDHLKDITEAMEAVPGVIAVHRVQEKKYQTADSTPEETQSQSGKRTIRNRTQNQKSQPAVAHNG